MSAVRGRPKRAAARAPAAPYARSASSTAGRCASTRPTSGSGASGAYLYSATDKHGEAVDFLLTAKRDLEAAKRFFRKMLRDGPLLSPDRIGTDGAGTYPGAIAAARKEGRLARDPVHHVTKHLQQGIESDHFRLKKNMPRVGGFQSFNTARRSI